jgi:glycosyltransferase involved in cell wall biosynthesis
LPGSRKATYALNADGTNRYSNIERCPRTNNLPFRYRLPPPTLVHLYLLAYLRILSGDHTLFLRIRTTDRSTGLHMPNVTRGERTHLSRSGHGNVPSDSIRLSIIVPVHNNPRDLQECLAALRDQCRADSEIIVVDDASTDDTPSVAARSGARLLRLAKNSGPAAARNHGAKHARGEILLFVDADVIVAPGVVARLLTTLGEDPGVAAIFGSYDATPRADGIVSRYRNLLHHFVHQNGHAEASTFWAGCGAIRRAVFQEVGGFDDRRFPRSSIEDIELGHRLHVAGHRIRLDKTIQGTHLKRWSLVSLMHTDVARRAIPWSRLTLEHKKIPATLNLTWDQRLSAVLIGLAGATLVLPGNRSALAALAAAAVAAVLVLNRRLYGFFFRHGGVVFALACIPLHFLYYLYSGLSYLYAWLEYRLRRRLVIRQRP